MSVSSHAGGNFVGKRRARVSLSLGLGTNGELYHGTRRTDTENQLPSDYPMVFFPSALGDQV